MGGVEKLYDKFLFNFLASSEKNAADIIEAGKGYIVPGIVSDKFHSIEAGAAMIKELKKTSPIVSVGLGGGGNPDNWRKVLEIAALSEPGHLNQPFETASYTKGFLDAKGLPNQIVNALVKPTGTVGKIQLSSGKILDVTTFLEIALEQGIESIKMMPVQGKQHLEELIYLTSQASMLGIRGVEPAGGIDATNIIDIIEGVKNIDIEFFMPHIFGSTIDPVTGETIPGKVKEIIEKVVGV